MATIWAFVRCATLQPWPDIRPRPGQLLVYDTINSDGIGGPRVSAEHRRMRETGNPCRQQCRIITRRRTVPARCEREGSRRHGAAVWYERRARCRAVAEGRDRKAHVRDLDRAEARRFCGYGGADRARPWRRRDEAYGEASQGWQGLQRAVHARA